jgi:hypothetical protein
MIMASNRAGRIRQMEPKMSKTYKPGQSAPRSGQYEIVGPRGGGTGKERTVVRGEPLPPTMKPGQGFQLVDPTKNGAGRR